MDSRSPKTVALLIESSRSYGRGLLRGIARFARTHGNWSLLHEEMTIDAGLPGWLSGSKVHGVIARVDDHIIGPLETLSVPIVDVRCRQAYPGIPQVETDDRAVSRLVFEHLPLKTTLYPGLCLLWLQRCPLFRKPALGFSRNG